MTELCLTESKLYVWKFFKCKIKIINWRKSVCYKSLINKFMFVSFAYWYFELHKRDEQVT